MRRRAMILAVLLALTGSAGGSAEWGGAAGLPSMERGAVSAPFAAGHGSEGLARQKGASWAWCPDSAKMAGFVGDMKLNAVPEAHSRSGVAATAHRGGIVALSAGNMPALAEGALPADAAVVSVERLGDLWLLRLAADTGETLLLLADEAGMPVRLSTETPAPRPAGGEQTAAEAAEAALAALPGALVLQVDTEGTEKAVRVATPCLFGTVWVSGGQVRRRSLTGGRFVSGGRLTLDGAYHAAQLARPEAVFITVEYDDEDDAYEGDALVSGVEYEFQIDARTGRLLEWERD